MKDVLNNNKENKVISRIIIYTPTLAGGVGKIVINLAKGLQKYYNSTKIIANYIDSEKKAALENEGHVEIINLNCHRTYKNLRKLVKYLKFYQPKIIISHIFHANLLVLLIKKIFRIKSKVIICEHISLKEAFKEINCVKRLFIKLLIKFLYPTANIIVGVSEKTSEEIKKLIFRNKNIVKTIYNPVIEDKIFENANEVIIHPWLTDDRKHKIILSVGRLMPQKSFDVLIKAFQLVRRKINAKLIILGEGEERSKLEMLIKKLDLIKDVDLLGFVENPYPYFKKSDVFVLSSKYEGLPTVLIEALAFGLPLVSTDCPTGPSEILEDGQCGMLIKVGDYFSMAEAILKILQNNKIFSREILIKQADKFRADDRIKDYIELINSLL